MKIFHLIASLLALFFALPSMGQNDDAPENNAVEEDGPKRFWQVSVAGGHYMVALDRIASVSMHEYVLDGNLLVREVTIDTTGRALARFYHIEPVSDSMNQGGVTRAIDRGRDLLDRAGQIAGTNLHEKAQKNYPTTTHAGTVEYRILDRRDLEALHGSINSAWISGKGHRLTIK